MSNPGKFEVRVLDHNGARRIAHHCDGTCDDITQAIVNASNALDLKNSDNEGVASAEVVLVLWSGKAAKFARSGETLAGAVTILAAALAIFATSPASAQPGNPYYDAGYRYGQWLNSQSWREESVYGVRPRPAPNAVVIAIEEANSPERAARVEKWERYCDPQLSAPDRNGVRRYIYAKPGCEHGRSED